MLEKILNLRYPLFIVFLFILGVVLHNSGIFYNISPEEMENTDSWTPIIIPIILAVIWIVTYKFKLLGTK